MCGLGARHMWRALTHQTQDAVSTPRYPFDQKRMSGRSLE
jgi:hypothetical protein